MIGIIDYGLGNLRSVAGAVERLGFEWVITDNVKTLDGADKLILPGVGAYGDGMRKLNERGLVEPLSDLVLNDKKPILGICLGFQLFAKEGTEFGYHKGLGWIDTTVRSFRDGGVTAPVPHIGWNDLDICKTGTLFKDVPDDALFYYVHSYYVDGAPLTGVTATCHYDLTFTAAIELGNIYGVQFHPEKSQRHGLTVLRNFLEKSEA